VNLNALAQKPIPPIASKATAHSPDTGRRRARQCPATRHADGMADVRHRVVRKAPKVSDAAKPTVAWTRDRFILSGGHGVHADLFAGLHLTGYAASFPLEEIKELRQYGARRAGTLKNFLAIAIETPTGPLGQGSAKFPSALPWPKKIQARAIRQERSWTTLPTVIAW